MFLLGFFGFANIALISHSLLSTELQSERVTAEIIDGSDNEAWEDPNDDV